MGFPRQEFPFPGDLPRSGIESESSALAGGFFMSEPSGRPVRDHYWCSKYATLYFLFSIISVSSIRLLKNKQKKLKATTEKSLNVFTYFNKSFHVLGKFWQIKQYAIFVKQQNVSKDAIECLHDLTSHRKEKGNYNYFMYQMRTIMLKPEGNTCREHSVQYYCPIQWFMLNSLSWVSRTPLD